MRWFGLAVLVVMVLVFAACGADEGGGSGGGGAGDAASEGTAPDGGSFTRPSPPETDPSETGGELLGELVTEQPTFEAPADQARLQSENSASSVTLADTEAYLDATVRHADTIWSNWFKANGLQEPWVGYEILMPGEQYTTRCSTRDGKNTFDHTHPNAFYCSVDPNQTDNGMVVLPAQTMANMWSGNIFERKVSSLQRVGDFAAGIITAHEFGHHIQDELSEQTGVQGPVNPNSELIADCFAGVWAFSVFLDSYLEEGDIDEALNALGVIGDELGSHGTPTQRQTAFLIGYGGTQQTPGGGQPYRCIEEYWR